MSILFDPEATQAAFSVAACDGAYDPDFANYLAELGEKRPCVVLVFPPKAAGTYLRSAAIVAAGGALVRTVYAQGGRDASFYLPTFLLYYAGGFPTRTMVTHVHMQALPANRHFIDALGLKPVTMVRAIPDMLASYWDMLDSDLSPDNWLNAQVPHHFSEMDDQAKADFLIDMFGPWYASYYASWFAYAAEAPDRVLVLDYDAFRADPVATLAQLLAHSGLPRSPEQCRLALDAVWEERKSFRFNRGVSGRGAERFTPDQIGRLKRQLSYYPNLAGMMGRLVPGG
jgi:hypothetical protein